MSKSKKRHNNSSAAVRARARDSALADKQVRDRARMDPVARSLLQAAATRSSVPVRLMRTRPAPAPP